MTSPTPEERAEAPRHIFTFRIDGQLDPIAIKACSQIQGTSTGIKWIVGGPLGKAIASAIREAAEAEKKGACATIIDGLTKMDGYYDYPDAPANPLLGEVQHLVVDVLRSRSEQP